MSEVAFVEQTIGFLERTPRVLRELLWDLPDEWLGIPDTEGGWTARDVVGHLITGEQTDWIARTQRILEDGTSRAFDRFDRFEMLERDQGVTLNELISRFADLRAANLVRLRELVTEDADVDRRGLHPSLGEVTLRELLATWSVHDLDHTAQIYASLAASRDAAVGPWKAYLGILLRRDDPSAVAG